MLITEGKDGFLIFSWYEFPHRKKSAALAEDKVTRRRINAIFRAVDDREIVGKALRRLWADEKSGLDVSDGYEYAIVLDEYISMVVNSRF